MQDRASFLKKLALHFEGLSNANAKTAQLPAPTPARPQDSPKDLPERQDNRRARVSPMFHASYGLDESFCTQAENRPAENQRAAVLRLDPEMGLVSGGEPLGIAALEKNAAHANRLGHGYSSCRRISSSLGLCLASRPVRGSVSNTRAGLGWPTRARALAFTALVAENFAGLRFLMPQLAFLYGLAFLCRKDEYGIDSVLGEAPETMEEREFFNETTEQRSHTLTCPKCGQQGEYKVSWVVRRKRAQLPRGADERDRARFAKAQSYMVRRDDKLSCANVRCRKPFEITQLQSLAFLSE